MDRELVAAREALRKHHDDILSLTGASGIQSFFTPVAPLASPTASAVDGSAVAAAAARLQGESRDAVRMLDNLDVRQRQLQTMVRVRVERGQEGERERGRDDAPLLAFCCCLCKQLSEHAAESLRWRDAEAAASQSRAVAASMQLVMDSRREELAKEIANKDREIMTYRFTLLCLRSTNEKL